MTRAAVLALAVAGAALTLIFSAVSHPQSAAAHPLGNFTINRYSRLELYSDAVRIRYVVDMAEIPAFQEVGEIDANQDGVTDPSESKGYLAERAAAIIDNLHLSLRGSRAELQTLSSDITYPEGQAGLRTLRINLLLQAPSAASNISLEYRDDNYSDRIGWKEIVVRPAAGVTVLKSTSGSDDISAELTSYPTDLLSSPLGVTSATVDYNSLAGARAPTVTSLSGSTSAEISSAREPTQSGFASLVDTEEVTVPVMALSLLLALGFGAIHALEPGHGKTFVAAYFVGVKGTVRQAFGLGLIVAMTHTVGVLTIGLVVLFGSQYILPERLYPWLSLASGVMVLGLGARLIAARAGGWKALHRLAPVFRREDRHNDDGHEGFFQNHGHTHEPVPGAPPWRPLFVLGLADGLTPSPSALVVLLAAVSLDRVGLGVLLIVAFSFGLAGVLTLVSLTLLYARRVVEWFGRNQRRGTTGLSKGRLGVAAAVGTSTLLRAAPLGGATALLAIGVLLTFRALTQPGLPIL